MDVKKQMEVIKRGAVNIISEEQLVKKIEQSIKNKKPLNIKAGFDPTAPDIHIGHTVLLRKLRQFQDLGHVVYFLIGDFTARIGDPTGRSAVRKQLTSDEVLANAATYKKQVSKILDMDKAKIVFNSHWFEKMPVVDILNLTTHATVSQMLARADFKKRMDKKEDISLLEFMYPLLQGYDSVKLEADVELGGTDQIFNLLVGRDMQNDFSMPQQVVITMPLLEGTDGVQKMSKSYGNYIGISEKPFDMFGKIMSISDELMLKYYTLLTDIDLAEVKKMHPKEAKLVLAQTIVADYHGKDTALSSKEQFQRVFSNKETPDDLSVYIILPEGENIIEILMKNNLASSRNEARRLIEQGAVSLNETKIQKDDVLIKQAGVLKAGKRKFLQLKIKP